MNPILKRTLTGIAVGLAVIAAILFVPRSVITPVVTVIAAVASLEFFMLLKKKWAECNGALAFAKFAIIFCIGEALIICGLSALAAACLRHGNLMLLYIVAIVKFSDVGGFAIGTATAKLMKGGNHKMCPTISPGKSWEGLIGSIIFSCAVSCAFVGATHFCLGKMLVLGFAAAILGTMGDLIESKFKRWVGVKDSSAMKITNGMGGILDMVDSLLIAPVVILFLI